MQSRRRFRRYGAICVALAAAGLLSAGAFTQHRAEATPLKSGARTDQRPQLIVSVTASDGAELLAGHGILIKADTNGDGRPDETVLRLTSTVTPQAVSGFELGRFWVVPGVPGAGYRYTSQIARFSTDRTNEVMLRVEPVAGRQTTAVTVIQTPHPADPAVSTTIPTSPMRDDRTLGRNPERDQADPEEESQLVVKAVTAEPPDRWATATQLLSFVPEDTRRQLLKLGAVGVLGFSAIFALGLIIRRRIRPKDSAVVVIALCVASSALSAAATPSQASAETDPSVAPLSVTNVAAALGLANNSMTPWVDIAVAGPPKSLVVAGRLPWGVGDRSVVLSTGNAEHVISGSPSQLASTSNVDTALLPDNPTERASLTLTTGAFTRNGRNSVGETSAPPACFVLRFTMLSEEYPEYIDADVADVFSVSTKDGKLATTQDGPNVISVDTVEWKNEPVGRFDGRSTSYGMVIPNTIENDGTLSNWQTFTFSVSDVGDTLYDTAVVIDDLRYVSDRERCDSLVLPETMDDADSDGLFDHWERSGADTDFDGTVDTPIHEMGADPLRHDVFVQLEAGAFVSLDPAITEAVIERFAALGLENPDRSTGVSLHISPPAEPAAQSAAERPVVWEDFQRQRAAALAGPTQSLFEYWWIVPKVHGADAWGGPGGFVTETFTPEVAVHEWGHSLGLRHAGPDDPGEERKPNHWSLMNAVYLFGTGDSTGMDFSNFESTTLDERALVETDGIGPAEHTTDRPVYWACPNGQWVTDENPADGVDWNCDRILSIKPVQADINASGKLAVLTGVNEWAEAALGMSGGRWWSGN